MITDFSNKFCLVLLIFVLSCSPNSKTSKIYNALQKIEDTECTLKSNLDLNKKFFVEKVICKNGYSFNFPDLGFDNENCRKPMKKIDGLKKPFFCSIDGETFIYVY
tara:strand:+ start:101 stop:418 length:318 start_codon:yes stop_codon:yes gene_type:complete